MGPIEYCVFGFPGNHFKGEIAPALAELVDNGTIRIIDLLFIMKDADGTIEGFELQDLPEDVGNAFGGMTADTTSLLNDDDIELAAESLPTNTAAALLVFENVWAERFAQAIRNADGELLANERIPLDVVQSALDAVQADS